MMMILGVKRKAKHHNPCRGGFFFKDVQDGLELLFEIGVVLWKMMATIDHVV